MEITVPGSYGVERPICGWPNLVEVANQAVRHFDQICDPSYGYMAYMGGSLGFSSPLFERRLWDWIEAPSYALNGRIVVRQILGPNSAQAVELGQRKLTLAAFHGLDGFAHRTFAHGWSEDLRLILWEQARVLFTLVAWFMESQEERLLSYVRAMLKALEGISSVEDGRRVFDERYWLQETVFGDVGPIVLVEPLMKYYGLTGDTDALNFCEGIIKWSMDPDTNFIDGDYRFSGWLRGLAAAISAITRFAAATSDDKLLRRCVLMVRSATKLTTSYGATPDTEPCCTNRELTAAAVVLAREGHTHYWDDVERWFRNQTIECQFLNPKLLAPGSSSGESGPCDDDRDIINRSIGGFSWATARERNVGARRLMLCCGGNAMCTLGAILCGITTMDADELCVNLHFSVDTDLASVTCHEPFIGRIEVSPRRAGRMRVRAPSYVQDFSVTINGKRVQPVSRNGYIFLDSVASGAHVIVDYPLYERSTIETTYNTPCRGNPNCGGSFEKKIDPVLKEKVQATWRGNTVMAIDYEGTISDHSANRLYQSRYGDFERGVGRNARARFYMPDQIFEW